MALTTAAFTAVLGDWVGIVIAGSLCLFAFATVLGWGLYGIRCVQYLFGEKSWKGFVYFQIIMVVLGAVADGGSLWKASEILNGLMAIPNLIAIFALTPVLERLLKQKTIGGNYESFHQRKSLFLFSHANVSSFGRCSQGSR